MKLRRWILFILGLLFPGIAAGLWLLGYGINEAVTTAGTTAIVVVEVISRLGGPGPVISESGPGQDLLA